MGVLVIVAAWHAVISSLMFTYHHNQPIHIGFGLIDIYSLLLAFLYIVMHLVFIISHFCDPYQYRPRCEKILDIKKNILILNKIALTDRIMFEIQFYNKHFVSYYRSPLFV